AGLQRGQVRGLLRIVDPDRAVLDQMPEGVQNVHCVSWGVLPARFSPLRTIRTLTVRAVFPRPIRTVRQRGSGACCGILSAYLRAAEQVFTCRSRLLVLLFGNGFQVGVHPRD